jgi:hypothetical protein
MRYREGWEGRTSRQGRVTALVPSEYASPRWKEPPRPSLPYPLAGAPYSLGPVVSPWTGAMRAKIATANFGELDLAELRVDVPRSSP